MTNKVSKTPGKTSTLKTLGSGKTTYKMDNPDKNILETFQNTAKDIVVPFVCNEFTSLCPKTGQPDFARFEIMYIPDKLCVESKSLKLYLFAFRNHGEFHEDVTNRIMEDIVEKIKPKYIRVFGDFFVRGGISIKPLAMQFSNKLSEKEKKLIQFKVECWDRLRHFDV